ncbi:MAG TPA: membrane protein insertion efficiency factor YidD [Candidatus Saccharimonadales bacterium]|nr:membrane protein insertion efficiency factor YidD [Candidatus Saccharimonadales bacterium]
MTKKIIKVLFFLYQGATRSQNATCRFHPTCSQYALDAVEKHGALKGSYLAAKRLLSCHPFSQRPYYDPI